MPRELEAKVTVNDAEAKAVMAKMQSLTTGDGVGMVEVNQFFDMRGQLQKRGETLRVRKVDYYHLAFENACVITHKGPLLQGEMKQREETELKMPSRFFEDAASLLTALGYKVSFTFEKRRLEWQYLMCTVCLDELPLIGRFVEVEGGNPDLIRRVLSTLGLNRKRMIKDGYPVLLRKHMAKRRKLADLNVVQFDDPVPVWPY